MRSPLVQQIMRWDMAVLRESPWYQEIEQRGIQQGARRQLIRVLQQRFGEIPLYSGLVSSVISGSIQARL
ncbi:DUF4351 domain-containing protein [Nostoc favosum]|uniref:DUF4351 domain-containing protein n=1 Tax=Nostoc favosum CHAB5714 TaxID=2780399 RepID=A0ABS8I8Q1_9NOSO|nr:DUF4351 domain-containing protein [Nostoc favosum]MCC5600178.1 DUF4351 domain-containing protein [Nostoc favosum CHAB5714]